MSLALVVLAAGMGSRYGGLKQVDPVGPSGETMLDYAVFDAIRAGFTRVVFVIRRDFDALFREKVGARYAGRVTVDYVYQSLDALPPGGAVPAGREKPWGTGHAVWCAREAIRPGENFAVINADDFYGADSFAQLGKFLRAAQGNEFAMVGFRMANTLSEHGTVSRGVTTVGTSGALQSIVEVHGISADIVGEGKKYSGGEFVSMNCWGFTPALFRGLDVQFAEFLRERGHDPKAEFYLPAAVSAMIARGECTVRVLPTESTWFGVTYREDKPRVQSAITGLVERKHYPAKLFCPMKLSRPDADVYLPELSAGLSADAALERTTHLCVIAHQDDIEINAYPAVAECYGQAGRFFTGVVMTNGAGSARTGKFAHVTDADMQRIRREEQRRAADIGRYNLQIQLGHASSDVKRPGHSGVRADLVTVFGGCGPALQTVYLHQPMDKHDTHVACFLRSIEAIRTLPRERRPRRVLGVEGWRDLDWLADADKVALDASPHPELAEKLIHVFESQVVGGKRYDRAALGRRAANATFLASHATDTATSVALAIDLTPLVQNEMLSPLDFALNHVDRFRSDVATRLRQLGV